MFGLWVLAGLACVVSVVGMFSIGILVAPLALGLVAVAVVVTVRRPGSWPAVAGLGLALAAGIAWLGVVLARSGPATGSCSATADGVVTCLSEGRPVAPDAFATAMALPWFVAAALVAALTLAGYAAARTRVRAAGVGT